MNEPEDNKKDEQETCPFTLELFRDCFTSMNQRRITCPFSLEKCFGQALAVQ